MEKGQFWPFRLLIASIFAFAMLVIITSAINYFHTARLHAGTERFAEGFGKALDAVSDDPRYGTVIEKGILLPAGFYTAGQFAEKYKINSECIEFQAAPGQFLEVSVDRRMIELKNDFEADVFFKCMIEDSAICENYCYIGFNMEPRVE